ncbi:MAG: TIGR03790 family protein [Luteolibacter sp.]
MKFVALVWLGLVGFPAFVCAAPTPESVAILYNSTLPESKQLAEIYREARGIPIENMIALDMPQKADVSREEFNHTILQPLRNQFEHRSWWKREKDREGLLLPVVNKIRVIVLMRGVPLRIQQTPIPPAPPAAPNTPPPPPPLDPIQGHDEASVDSELAMFGVEGLPTKGVLQNKFYQSEESIKDVNLPFLVLTARIDSASFATCERMIHDALESEKSGLWGRAYVDIANKFPLGDKWLEEVVKENEGVGIPTVIDRFNDTLPKNYPMTDASVYYGWYDGDVSGPFLNSSFRFRKGAVAMHLHSFSAMQLGNPNKNWSAALLERGAAVTVGNVYEPYLHLTHDFSIVQKRLLAGATWVEACWAAMPVTSWQGVVLGDPLYRPFRHLDGSGEKNGPDIEYRALRACMLQWAKEPVERVMQLEKASERMKSGVITEALGLDYVRNGKTDEAAQAFRRAKDYYVKTDDKMRQDFNIISIDRLANRKNLAIRGLRDAQIRYGPIPESSALQGWLDILDPPPPPPADPSKVQAVKKPEPEAIVK